jgi:hypothetical protein
MAVLAGLCVWIGLAPQTMVYLALRGGAFLIRADILSVNMGMILEPLSIIIGVSFLFLSVILILTVIRRLRLGDKAMPVQETWSCGFSQVSSRFQYTSSSFARPIIKFVSKILLVRRHGGQVTGGFPNKTPLSSYAHDVAEDKIFRPLLAGLINISKKIDNSLIRYTQVYLMCIFLFLLFLLAWKMR